MKRQFSILFALAGGLALPLSLSCSAGTNNNTGGDSNGGKGSGGHSTTGGANMGGSDSGASDAGGSGAGFVTTGGGGDGGSGGGIVVNPCGTGCGPDELCDGVHRGLDDDCDGEVDEGCPCGAGEASSCFKGDSSFLSAGNPGCHAGTMSCSELGTWGPCLGGSHAVAPDNCQSADLLGCHGISTSPFTAVDLATGAGNFDDNAQSETYQVTCPVGVNPCPAPSGSSFQPVVSGEYTVHYTKVVNGMNESCDFPLYVGAKGLRVELSWNYASNSTIDLDLHMKQPMSAAPWAILGAPQDCGYGNCKGDSFLIPFGDQPEWFPANNVVPDPVNWYEDPNYNANSCYFAPRGAGSDWTTFPGPMGCHNPRLDIDNISCTPSVADPNSYSFCAPENINVDYPPKNQWTRIAVHYYEGTSNYSGQVYPNVKIYCDGALAAELGTQGYHTPESPFVWTGPADENKVWLVADVLFREDQCVKECIVQPLRVAPNNDPVVVTRADAETSNGPAYPQMP
ncbi:MAG: hypothetical protein U0271_05515 [Polyangiaceae bacterium]